MPEVESTLSIRAATAGKAPKAWALPRFWVSIRSYKKQPVKKIWGRILDLAWLKFAVAALITCYITLRAHTINGQSTVPPLPSSFLDHLHILFMVDK